MFLRFCIEKIIQNGSIIKFSHIVQLWLVAREISPLHHLCNGCYYDWQLVKSNTVVCQNLPKFVKALALVAYLNGINNTIFNIIAFFIQPNHNTRIYNRIESKISSNSNKSYLNRINLINK